MITSVNKYLGRDFFLYKTADHIDMCGILVWVTRYGSNIRSHTDGSYPCRSDIAYTESYDVYIRVQISK